jgi:hypothetical protein
MEYYVTWHVSRSVLGTQRMWGHFIQFGIKPDSLRCWNSNSLSVFDSCMVAGLYKNFPRNKLDCIYIILISQA